MKFSSLVLQNEFLSGGVILGVQEKLKLEQKGDFLINKSFIWRLGLLLMPRICRLVGTWGALCSPLISATGIFVFLERSF